MAFTYTYSATTDIPGGVFGAAQSDQLRALINANIASATLSTINSDGAAISVVFSVQLSAADKTKLDNNQVGPAGGFVGRCNDSLQVKDGSTIIADGGTISIAANSLKTIDLQYLLGGGATSTGHSEAVSITPSSLIVITNISGSLDANGHMTFNIGPDTRKGLVSCQITAGTLPPRNVYFKFL
jgi:hypothetical protein